MWAVADVYEQALRRGGPLALAVDGRPDIPLDVPRWLGAATPADRTVIDRCVGATLDVGCGPGRIVRALAARGVVTLGVDLAPSAVDVSLGAGGCALRRDVFGRLPGEGRWCTVLLLDGNIGIGGDPFRLLLRTHQLLRTGATLIVEASPALRGTHRLVARLRTPDRLGPRFPWAHVGRDGIRAHAAEAGFREAASWTAEEREFLAFTS